MLVGQVRHGFLSKDHVMNQCSDVSVWNQVAHLKSHLETNYIEQEIHWAQRARQSWFLFGDMKVNSFKLWSLLGSKKIQYEKLRMLRVTGLTIRMEFGRLSLKSFKKGLQTIRW